MLVLKYGIECDLLEEGNVKIVDGEIEITSEAFLRELGKKIGSSIARAIIEEGEWQWVTIEIENVFADKELLEDFVCLEIQLAQREQRGLLDALNFASP